MKDSNVDLAERLKKGIQFHQSGELDAAEALYRETLAVSPTDPDALNFLGMLMYERDEVEKAERLLLRAVIMWPEFEAGYQNLGNVYSAQHILPMASRCYERALEINPENTGTLINLSIVKRKMSDFKSAVAICQSALQKAPGAWEAHFSMGIIYRSMGKLDQAIEHLREAAEINPVFRTRNALGGLLSNTGRLEEAQVVLEQVLADDPDCEVSKHMLAAARGEKPPPRATDAYIKSVFDDFASKFDDYLDQLSYVVPKLIGRLTERVAQSIGTPINILDLGCGTGLCGLEVKHHAKRLIGVDLSGEMLKRAQATGVYDELVEAELTAFLESHNRQYELVVCGDTLCYFGELQEVLCFTASRLTQGGYFLLTVESGDGIHEEHYRLGPSGRYSHRKAFVLEEIERAALTLEQCQEVELRTEGGKPVAGYLVTTSLRP